MKKTGLFFGSFNPVHVGHMIIANYMATQTELEEVWLVVSPQNPFKQKASLARDYDRLHLVQLAVGDNPRLRASDVEFALPKPSFTIDTLAVLRERYPDRAFSLIMGGDNLLTLPNWKNYEIILRDYSIYVYERPGYSDTEATLATHPAITRVDAPQLYLSASYVRDCIQQGYSVRYLLPDAVYAYLQEHPIYR